MPGFHIGEYVCASQVARCPYHNTQHFRISLFSNYQAGIEQLPTQPHQVSHHPPSPCAERSRAGSLLEITLAIASDCCMPAALPVMCQGARLILTLCCRSWTTTEMKCGMCKFSHSGTMLASASKDTTALIWRVDSLGEPMLMHTLAGHEKAVAFLTWSPDDTCILTCGADNEVRIL